MRRSERSHEATGSREIDAGDWLMIDAAGDVEFELRYPQHGDMVERVRAGMVVAMRHIERVKVSWSGVVGPVTIWTGNAGEEILFPPQMTRKVDAALSFAGTTADDWLCLGGHINQFNDPKTFDAVPDGKYMYLHSVSLESSSQTYAARLVLRNPDGDEIVQVRVKHDTAQVYELGWLVPAGWYLTLDVDGQTILAYYQIVGRFYNA